MSGLPLRSITNEMSLAEVTGRLAGHPTIDALLYIGSTGQPHFNPQSDFDLLLVCNEKSLPADYIITTIDGRLSDLILITIDSVDILPGDGSATALIHWLQSGQIAFDKSNRLARAQKRLANYTTTLAADSPQNLDYLIAINYNLRQNERMLRQPDPVYQDALEMRLLYGISEILMAYFALRQLPWRGEKEAVRHLQKHDAEFLALFQETVRAKTLNEKMTFCRQIAQRAVAPAGPLWPADASHISRNSPSNLADLLDGWSWWCSLMDHNRASQH